MNRRYYRLFTALGVFLLAACASPPPQTPSASTAPASGTGSAQTNTARVSRTLVMAGRAEIPSIASKPLRNFGLTSGTMVRLFNAGLALKDAQGVYRPDLAEALPQLNTDTWKVFPDGRMETTYKLRPNLVWHDSHPLTADDWVFAYEVYSNPDSGLAASPPISLMEDVAAPDARTLVIHWKRPYFDAPNLDASGGSTSPAFPAMPRHILEQPFHQNNVDTFVSLPWWNTEYVGLGPYKLDKWEQGSFLEAVAFDQYALGRPQIERVRLLFIPDFNTSVANMLAGEAHITVDDSIRFQQGLVIRREWEPRKAGTVLVYPTLWRWTHIQQRPELAKPTTLVDARVRKALAHGLDKTALSDALFEGEGILTESPVPPTAPYFADVDRASAKYPYDLRRTEQLMTDAGYRKGGDGVWAHPTAGRFEFQLTTFQSPQNESEMHVLAASWRQAGFDVSELVWPASASSDAQLRNTHPSLVSTSGPAGEPTLVEHNSGEVPTAANRWSGSNRGGWTNSEFDGLAQQFNSTLDRSQRAPLIVQMAKIFSDDAAVISLYFNPTATAFVAGLSGPQPTVPDGTLAWNIHEWYWTQ